MVPGCASSLQPNLPKASQRRGHRFSKHAPLWQCMIPASGCSIPQSLRFLRYVRYLELHLWHQKETFQKLSYYCPRSLLATDVLGGWTANEWSQSSPSFLRKDTIWCDMAWHEGHGQRQNPASVFYGTVSRGLPDTFRSQVGAKTIKHDATSCADFATNLQSHKVWQRCRVVD